MQFNERLSMAYQQNCSNDWIKLSILYLLRSLFSTKSFQKKYSWKIGRGKEKTFQLIY